MSQFLAWLYFGLFVAVFGFVYRVLTANGPKELPPFETPFETPFDRPPISGAGDRSKETKKK